MEPVLSLKRKQEINLKQCIFCQKTNTSKHELRAATEYSKRVVQDALEERRKLRELGNREIIDRLDKALPKADVQLNWHPNCYAQFTNKEKIRREKQKQLQAANHEEKVQKEIPTTCSTRSHVVPVDWNFCMFCQDEKKKERLSAVMTDGMSSKILEMAALDCDIRIRVAGECDLIAVGAKYHLSCFRRFMRATAKTAKMTARDDDVPMVFLATELEEAANKGHVVKLDDAWNRYLILADDAGFEVPASYLSRKSTFKEKLLSVIGHVMECILPLGYLGTSDQLLIPSKYVSHAVPRLVSESCKKASPGLSLHQPDDIFLSLVHVALKVRGDLQEKTGHQGFQINEERATSCIPESLYMFLRILFGGSRLFEGTETDEQEAEAKQKVLSIAQDIVYGVSHGKKWTPKHIGLASVLHQATRSRELVRLFHKAGHTLSYEQILEVDTSLAESVLRSFNSDTGAVIPPNLVHGKFVHFSADNIDILEETVDGKNTFHATQIAAWQRGNQVDIALKDLRPSTKRTLEVPETLNKLYPVKVQQTSPIFDKIVESNWYTTENENKDALSAQATDLAFHLLRRKEAVQSGWKVFNQWLSKNQQEVTTIGYMPILRAPAHELDTLNTVVRRCMHVSTTLGQEHVVITVDEALYCKLMQLKWMVPDYRKKLIVHLGGLHTSLCFLKVIGKHMSGSGIAEAWVESGLLGPNATEQVLSGRHYKRAIRAHTITLQSLWHLLMPLFLEFCQNTDPILYREMTAASSVERVEELVGYFKSTRLRNLLDAFCEKKSSENVNFSFWWGYMEMISVLLMFIRAQREGNWSLYMHSFRSMLPFFMRYDHVNYARWGCVYVAEMQQLPEAVKREYMDGNFVVKWNSSKFNQVSPDHSLEWLNGVGKRHGGIKGITQTPSALNRWALSYNCRSMIGDATRLMLGLKQETLVEDSEHGPERQQRNSNAVESELCNTLKQFNVFSPDVHPTCLYSIASKDLATEDVQESLLNAKTLGQEQLKQFVEERLKTDPSSQQTQVKLEESISRNNAKTFDSLYDVVKQTKEKDKTTILRVDRNVLHRLVIAYEAGRKVDLQSVLKHELMPVPIALAETNGDLRTGQKSGLIDILTSDFECPNEIHLNGDSCLIIDGQALINSLKCREDHATFGDFADIFLQAVLKAGAQYQETHVVFDRYKNESIKAGTRSRRTKNMRPVRRVIEGNDVPLPKNWQGFLALIENKADLSRYLSSYLVAQAPNGKIIITSGGFADVMEAECSDKNIDVSTFRASHEEADTRLIYHALHVTRQTVVIQARDTDVLLLLLTYSPRISAQSLWMLSGTSKQRKYINIHDIYRSLPSRLVDSLLPFHALTGCDTTSYLYGHSKKSAWTHLRTYYELLLPLGEGELTVFTLKSAEKFVCCMYNLKDAQSIDDARCTMFAKVSRPELMPPTRNALALHVKRSHYQTLIWKQAHCPEPRIPPPEEMGWYKDNNNNLKPLLMTIDPIPEACQEVVSCSCKTGCQTLRCSCRKTELLCTSVCKCSTADSSTCLNRFRGQAEHI